MLTLHESNNLHLPVRFLEPTITMASYHLRRTFIKGLSCFRRRNIKKFSILFVLTLFILYLFHQQFQLGLRDFLYLTRPIWVSDVENVPQHRIVHFHSANLVPAARCALYGWTETLSLHRSNYRSRIKENYTRLTTAIYISNFKMKTW